MKTKSQICIERETQSKAARWAREAREMRDYLHATPPEQTALADYRRMRCIVAQTNAAYYHSWVEADLA